MFTSVIGIIIILFGHPALVDPSFICGDSKGLNNFECVVECATGFIALTSYAGYGCYCGFGGSGEPVDEIDRCCMYHDRCYDAAQAQHGCNILTEYTAQYKWSCNPNTDPYIRAKGIPVCGENNNDQCGRALCVCDSEAAMCFAKNPYPTHKPGCKRNTSKPIHFEFDYLNYLKNKK